MGMDMGLREMCVGEKRTVIDPTRPVERPKNKKEKTKEKKIAK